MIKDILSKPILHCFYSGTTCKFCVYDNLKQRCLLKNKPIDHMDYCYIFNLFEEKEYSLF